MKLLIDLVDYFFYVVSANIIVLAYLKYIFSQGYQFPFFSLMLMSAPIGMLGMTIMIVRILQFKGTGPLFYLSFKYYALLGLLYAGSYLCMVSSLYYENMQLVRFFVTMYCSDIFLQPILGVIFLKREFNGHYLLASLFAILAYVVEDYMNFYKKTTVASDGTTVIAGNGEIYISTAEGWEGPLLCFVGRLLFLTGTILS